MLCQYCDKEIKNKRAGLLGEERIFCRFECFHWYEMRLEKLRLLLKNCERMKNRYQKHTKLNKLNDLNKEIATYLKRLDNLTKDKNNVSGISIFNAVVNS